MCQTPIQIRDAEGRVSLAPCRNCKRCRGWKIGDFIGRCIAEQEHSTECLFITLTYAGDTPNAAFLNYPDVQNFLKSLRFYGATRKIHPFTVRYIVAGEYGSKRGRAHWHAVLFFKGGAPHWDLNKRITIPHWPHGHVYVDLPNEQTFGYVMKYMLKDTDAEVQRTHFAMSKKPPLGAEFFIKRADKLVEKGLSPKDGFYSFSGIRNKDGSHRQFYLRGRMREIFLDYYRWRWHNVHGTDYPQSGYVEKREDQLIRKQNANDEIEKAFQAREIEEQRKRLNPITMLTFEDGTQYAVLEHLPSGKVIVDMEGIPPWQTENEAAAKAEALEQIQRKFDAAFSNAAARLLRQNKGLTPSAAAERVKRNWQRSSRKQPKPLGLLDVYIENNRKATEHLKRYEKGEDGKHRLKSPQNRTARTSGTKSASATSPQPAKKNHG